MPWSVAEWAMHRTDVLNERKYTMSEFSDSRMTLDELYRELSLRESWRLFRYGVRVDNALDELGSDLLNGLRR